MPGLLKAVFLPTCSLTPKLPAKPTSEDPQLLHGACIAWRSRPLTLGMPSLLAPGQSPPQ